MKGSVKASITIPTVSSCPLDKLAASKKCFSILLKFSPYSPIAPADEKTGKKKVSPFLKISGFK